MSIQVIQIPEYEGGLDIESNGEITQPPPLSVSSRSASLSTSTHTTSQFTASHADRAHSAQTTSPPSLALTTSSEMRSLALDDHLPPLFPDKPDNPYVIAGPKRHFFPQPGRLLSEEELRRIWNRTAEQEVQVEIDDIGRIFTPGTYSDVKFAIELKTSHKYDPFQQWATINLMDRADRNIRYLICHKRHETLTKAALQVIAYTYDGHCVQSHNAIWPSFLLIVDVDKAARVPYSQLCQKKPEEDVVTIDYAIPQDVPGCADWIYSGFQQLFQWYQQRSSNSD